MFSKQATKIDEIFTWRLLHAVNLTVKILSILVAFLENVNFTYFTYIKDMFVTQNLLFLFL